MNKTDQKILNKVFRSLYITEGKETAQKIFDKLLDIIAKNRVVKLQNKNLKKHEIQNKELQA